MFTTIICIVGFVLGMIISKKLGNSTEANILKVLIVIAIILFALINEGVI